MLGSRKNGSFLPKEPYRYHCQKRNDCLWCLLAEQSHAALKALSVLQIPVKTRELTGGLFMMGAYFIKILTFTPT